MKRLIAAVMLLTMMLLLAGCTIPVAGHPDEVSLIPPEDFATPDIDGSQLAFDPGAPIEEEASEDIVDNPLTDEEIQKALEGSVDPDMMNFEDGADAGEDFLGETEEPEPTATPTNKNPYYTKVDVTNQVVTVYGLDDQGEYTKVVRQMICSTGKNATPTPLGVFSIPGPVVRWGYFPKYNVYAQYLIRIKGSILFHSVLYRTADEKTLNTSSWYNLGKKASHGCIRLLPEDGKWLYENLKAGDIVEVYEGVKNTALTQSLLPPPPPYVEPPAPTPAPTPIPTETPEIVDPEVPIEGIDIESEDGTTRTADEEAAVATPAPAEENPPIEETASTPDENIEIVPTPEPTIEDTSVEDTSLEQTPEPTAEEFELPAVVPIETPEPMPEKDDGQSVVETQAPTVQSEQPAEEPEVIPVDEEPVLQPQEAEV